MDFLNTLGNFANGAVQGVEHFFGGGNPAPRPQPQAPPPKAAPVKLPSPARPSMIAQIGSGLGAAGNWALHNAPVLSNAYKFATMPQQDRTLGNFVKGITSTGYENSPLGALERTGARIAATVTQHPVVSAQGTTAPVNQQFGQAKGIIGKGMVGAGAIGDVFGANPAAEGLASAGKSSAAVAAKTPAAVMAANRALGQAGHAGLGEELGNMNDPVAVNNHLDYIDKQLNAMPFRLNMVKEEVARSAASPAAKQKLLSTTQDELNTEANNLKAEKATFTEHLANIGGIRRAPEPSIYDNLHVEAPVAGPSVQDRLKSIFGNLTNTLHDQGGAIRPNEPLGRSPEEDLAKQYSDLSQRIKAISPKDTTQQHLLADLKDQRANVVSKMSVSKTSASSGPTATTPPEPATPRPALPVEKSSQPKPTITGKSEPGLSQISKEEFAKAMNMKPEDLKPTVQEPPGKGLILAESKPNAKGGYYQTREMLPDPTSGKFQPTIVEHIPKGGGEYARHVLPPGEKPQYAGSEKHVLTPSEREDLIKNDPNQQTTNQHNFAAHEGNTKGAIVEAAGIENERQSRFAAANRLGKKLDKHDQNLLSERADQNVQVKPHNLDKFNQAAKAYDDAFDYHLRTDRLAGGLTLRYGRGQYTPLYLKATEEQMDKMQIPAEDRIKVGKYWGFRDSQRHFRSYTDAGAKGHERLYSSPVEDAKHYVEQSHTPILHNLVKKNLERVAPNEVGSLEDKVPLDEAGKPMTQAAGRLPFYASPKLQKELANFREVWKPGNKAGELAMNAGLKANNVSKASLFLGSPFHMANLEKNFRGLVAGTGHLPTYVKGLVGGLTDTVVPAHYAKVAADARASGVMDYAARNGLVMHDPKSYLSRFMNSLGLRLAQAAKDHGVVDGSPQATALFDEYNKVLGTINEVHHGTNPTFSRLFGGGTLAPHFSRSQLQLAADTALKSGKGQGTYGMFQPGAVARATVLGGRGTQAAAAIIVSALATGQLPNMKKMFNEAGLNPNNPVPNVDLGQHTKPRFPGDTPEHQVVDLPTDPLGLAAGLVTDPSHFSQSRLSPGLSFAEKVLTNQNWNGNPLVDPTRPHDASYYTDLVKNAAENSVLPIGVQNFTNLSNNPRNPSVAQGVIQELGGRIKTDPNDPQAIATKQYFDAVAKAKGGLNANELSAFQTAFPQSKSGTTGAFINNNSNTNLTSMTALKAQAMLTYPNVLKAATTMNQTLAKQGQKVDPFYTQLTPDQQKAYLSYEKMAPAGPDRTDWINQNKDWYTPFAQARTDYFNALPKGDPNKPTSPIKYPDSTPQVAQLQTQYDKMGAGPTRTAFLQAHPELLDQWAAQAKYNNDVRAATGYNKIKEAPNATPQLQKYIDSYNAASKGDRKAMRTANPGQYQEMVAYYDSSDLTTIGKESAVSNLQGEPNATQKELKSIASLAGDIYKDPNGTYSIVPAGWLSGAGGTGSNLTAAAGGGSFKSGGSTAKTFKASTNFGTTDTKLNELVKASTKMFTPKTAKLGGSSSHIKKISMGKAPKRMASIKPRRATSLKSNGMVKLA